CLVGVQIGIEPGMGVVPAEATIRRPDAVALFDRASRVRGERPEEESVEVLFTRQVSAPGRESHGAVVERAQNVPASRVVDRLQPVITCRGAPDPNLCLTGD